MADSHYIDHPEQLLSLAQDWKDSHQDGAKFKICLPLLQPLTIPDILAACRDPLSKFMTDGRGNKKLDCPTNHEYLDITALGKLWRTACMQVPPAAIRELCFELSLPRRSADDGDGEDIYWETNPPDGAFIAVRTPDYINLVMLLAMTFKVREGGPGIRYSLREVEDERRRGYPKAWAELGSVLERLSVYSNRASSRAV